MSEKKEKGFPDPISVANRTIEILGGAKRTRQLTDEEFGEMSRRWNQDTESIGRILRAHLYVEHYMTEYLEKSNPRLGSVTEAKLSFAQKLSLLDPHDPRLGEVLDGVKRLNAIRNRLAHRLNASVTADDATIFLRAPYFNAMREARVAPEIPSNDPLDILEDFAKHASHAFTHRFSQVAQAFALALSEVGDPSVA